MTAREGAVVRSSRTLKHSEVREALRRHPFNEAARALGVSPDRLRRDFPAAVYAARAYRKQQRQDGMRTKIIAQVKSFAAQYGRPPLVAEFGYSGDNRKHPNLPWYSTVLQYFLNYRELFQEAGFPAPKLGRAKGVA